MGMKRIIAIKLGKGEFCPISSHSQSVNLCKKEKCAWWIDDGVIGMCAIKSIAHALGDSILRR